MSRICEEVRTHLPGLVDGTLPRWRGVLVRAHLRRCEGCQRELERQEAVASGLRALGAAAAEDPEPPDGLLETLLEQAERGGLRGRAAVPARGAVSGARPALSALLLVAGAAAGTTAGYAAWRSARALRRRASGRRTSGRRR